MFQTSAALKAQGYSSRGIRRLAEREGLRRVRRGVYTTEESLTGTAARHRELVRATMPLLVDGSVVSHWSAAILHGLPVWDEDLSRVAVSRSGSGNGTSTKHVRLHRCDLDDADTELIDGVRS